MSQSRQLAAIMFTDIVGYTTLMGEDEQKAFELLKKNRLVQKPIIERYNGRWLKEIGDGVLASFNAVSDAVYCAGAIQKACENEPDLKLRIGIHLGEVVFKDNDVFGDGVNIASRIESLAPAGGIYCSESVFMNVENKKGINAEFVGEKNLKNVKHPIRIFSITDEKRVHDVHSNQAIGKESGSEKSIAVLPFVNISSDAEQEYFSDGLTEEVITDLSQLSDLLVISRSSIITFKGTTKKLKEIANELNVRYVLEGSVRKAGNNLRITAQLIDAQTDVHLWAEKYNGSIDDIFEIQENVSRSIVEALSIRLNQSETRRLSNRPISNVDAYELYQKAQFEIYRFKRDGLNRAIQYLNDALEIEGDNILIFAKMGIVYCTLISVSNTYERDYFKKARHFADKVFELDPNNPMGHTILGWIAMYDGDIRDAVRQIRIADQANPGNTDNLFLLILGHFYLGQSEQAEKYTKKMGDVDPYNPVYNGLLSLMYYMKGDLNKAAEEVEKGYKLYPEVPQLQLYHAYFLVINGDQTEAIRIIERYINNTSESIYSILGVLLKCAILEKDPDGVVTPDIAEKLKLDVEWCWLVADLYAIMGRKDQAIDWLEYAVSRGFINYPLLSKYDPFLENIRNEDRFSNLMERVKIMCDELRDFG